MEWKWTTENVWFSKSVLFSGDVNYTRNILLFNLKIKALKNLDISFVNNRSMAQTSDQAKLESTAWKYYFLNYLVVSNLWIVLVAKL